MLTNFFSLLYEKKLTIRPVIIGPILENDDDMVENEALVSLGVKTLISMHSKNPNKIKEIRGKEII